MSARQELTKQSRNGNGGDDNSEASVEFAWLLKARPDQIVGWLAGQVPSGSKAEAIAFVRRLEERITEECPKAGMALHLIALIAEALEAEVDGRPLLAPPGDLLAVTVDAWQVIQRWTKPQDPRRFLARFGDAIVRLERSDSGALGTMPLDQGRMINLLARVARWGAADPLFLLLAQMLDAKVVGLEVDELIAKLAKLRTPPPTVAQNLLADPEHPLPLLERVVETPVLARDGRIHSKPGYDHASKCFYAPAPGLQVPPIPEKPTRKDIADAVAVIDELLTDFPFVPDPDFPERNAERAHAIAFMVEPFARDLIDGATPAYLFDAPTPGTGKTLLAQTLATPMLGGRRLALMAEARDDDEWRKRLTAKLRTAPTYLVIDNVKRVLDSGALAMMITAGVVEDRLLGVSEIVTMPVRCTLGISANNISLSDEMARRVVRIRLDSGEEAPEDREGFLHHLPGWAVENRGLLVSAVLTLCRAWIVAGQPPGPEKPLGSFESWSRTLGGILHVAGVKGFLGNVKEVRAHTRDTDHADLLQAIYAKHGDEEFVSGDIVELARPILRLGDVADATAAQRIGTRLRQIVDRPVSGLVLRREGKAHASGRKWRVEISGGSGKGSPSSPPSPESALGGEHGEHGEHGEGNPPPLEKPPAVPHGEHGEDGEGVPLPLKETPTAERPPRRAVELIVASSIQASVSPSATDGDEAADDIFPVPPKELEEPDLLEQAHEMEADLDPTYNPDADLQ